MKNKSKGPKSLEQRLKDGELFSTKDAAKIISYSEQHLRRMCREGKVDCIKRGQTFFLTPDQIEAVFKLVIAQK